MHAQNERPPSGLECFANLAHSSGSFPVSEEAAKRTLALPIYPELTSDQQAYVVDAIDEFFGK